MQLAASNVQWRIAGRAGVIDMQADRIERIDEVADRPLMHACHAVQGVIAAHDGQRCRQRPDRRAGIAHEQVGLMHGEAAIGAMHEVIPAFAILGPLHAELLQGHQHNVRVV